MKKTVLILLMNLFFSKLFCQAWIPIGPGIPATDWSYDLVNYKNRMFTCGQSMLVKMQAWDGTKWDYVLNINSQGIAYPLTMAVYNDTLYAGGDFPYTSPGSHVFKYADTAWLETGGEFLGGYGTKKLFTYNGKLIAGGSFSTINALPMKNVAQWNGSTWSTMGNGLNGLVVYFAEHNGQLFASGGFSASGTKQMKNFAKWDGAAWSAIDSTQNFKRNGPMISFNGNLVMANVYDTINGTPMYGVTTWDGFAFRPMGSVPEGTALDFCIFNNELYLCMDFVVRKWTGSAWVQVGGTFNDRVFSLAHYNNELFCSGFYSECDGQKLAHVSKFSTTVGLNEIENELSLNVYPNPAGDQVFIQCEKSLPENLIVTISNSLGELVYQKTQPVSDQALEIQYLKPGIYYLKVQSDSYQKIVKLVKE